MTIFKHFFWLIVYTVITINCIAMSAQYFLGINNIVSKVFGLIDDVNLAAMFQLNAEIEQLKIPGHL